MNFLDDFKARWAANEQRFFANRFAFMPSPIEHAECEHGRNQLCRELVGRFATVRPAPEPFQLADLIAAAQFACQSLAKERDRPCPPERA